MKTCTPGKLLTELDQLRTILRNNGYPDNIVERTFKIVMEKDERRIQLKAEENATMNRVLLKLPYIGLVSESFRKEIIRAKIDAYPTIQPTIVFTTRHAFQETPKDVLPATAKRSLIYL